MGMKEQYAPSPAIQEIITELHAPQPTVIALEGGPCGGKTTVVNRLVQYSEQYGRPVVVLPEAATEHIAKLQDAGLSIPDLLVNDREGFLAFEADVLKTIVANIETAKKQWKDQDALIVSDRSDIGAYVTAEEYDRIMQSIGHDKPPLLTYVDKLVYLPSLAREDAERYESLLVTNTSRYETAEQAIDTCRRTLGAVAIHPEMSVYWGGDFEDKVGRIRDEIFNPEREVESKFTADGPVDYAVVADMLDEMTAGQLSESYITQSYHTLGEHEFRLRESQLPSGRSVYHYSVKTGEGDVRQELTRLLTREQYEELRTAPSRGELQKIRRRYLFELGGEHAGRQTVLSADFYTDRNLCVLELEGMTDAEAGRYDFPGFNQGGVSARELVQ